MTTLCHFRQTQVRAHHEDTKREGELQNACPTISIHVWLMKVRERLRTSFPGWKETREMENLDTMHELEQDPQQPRESLKQVALVTLKTDTPSICRVVVLCIWNAPPGLTWIPSVQLLDLLWKAMDPLRGGAPLKEVGHWWQTCSLTARPHFLCPCCTLVSPCRP